MIYNLIKPGWFSTVIYGNNHFLFGSAYFWLCIPLTVCLALAPRYLFKAWKFGYRPNDVDILRYIAKKEPHRDLAHDALYFRHDLDHLKRPTESTTPSRRASLMASRTSLDLPTASRTDMSTGIRSTHRGFNFAMEENGVAMRRMQTNLSERRQSSRNLTHSESQQGQQPQQVKGRGRASTLLGSIKGKLKKKSSNKFDSTHPMPQPPPPAPPPSPPPAPASAAIS